MGEKYFRESDQLIWVKNMFRNLSPNIWGYYHWYSLVVVAFVLLCISADALRPCLEDNKKLSFPEFMEMVEARNSIVGLTLLY